MLEITIGGFSVLAVVYVLVELIKGFGVSGKFLPIISIALGMVIGAVSYFCGAFALTEALIGGFFAGASASGVYDIKSKTLSR